MAVVGVLALQGSFNEHIAGMFVFVFLSQSLFHSLTFFVVVVCGSAEEVRSEWGRDSEAGAASQREFPHHPWW